MKFLCQLGLLSVVCCCVSRIGYAWTEPPYSGTDELARAAVLNDGSRLTARIASIDRSWNVTLETDERQYVVGDRELAYWGFAEPSVRGKIILLADGGRIAGEIRRISADRITMDSRIWQPVEIPLDCVAGILLQPSLDALARDRQINELLDLNSESDQVKLATGDSLEGFILESTKGQTGDTGNDGRDTLTMIVMEIAGDEVVLPVESVVSLRWRGAIQSIRAGPERMGYVGIRDGSWFACRQVRSQRDHVEFELGCGVVLKTRAADGLTRGMRRISAVYPASERFVRLDQIRPAQFQSLAALQPVWSYATNRNVRGGMLRLPGQIVPFGFGMHPAGSLAFATDGEYRRLRGEIALDHSAGDSGSVTFTVHVTSDGQSWEEAYASPVVRGGEAPIPIDVDISEARFIALGVGFADRGDVLDHANWLNVRLMK